MRFGVRKPSIKKSVKARTTGRAKRAVKKAVIPGYGKKGIGWVKNPQKAAYNKVYNKTSVGVSDVLKSSNSSKSSTENNLPYETLNMSFLPWYKKTGWTIFFLIVFFPIGIFLMWSQMSWNKNCKIIVTCIYPVMYLLSFVTTSKFISVVCFIMIVLSLLANKKGTK